MAREPYRMSEYGLDPTQFRDSVIRPTLQRLLLHSTAAEQLVLGTMMVESNLRYLTQLGGGPGLGFGQCEPATHDDVWANYLKFRASLATLVRQYGSSSADLVRSLAYSVAICRVHYLRVPERLPDAGDAVGMARYHKRWYNTALGATKTDESVKHFRRACALP